MSKRDLVKKLDSLAKRVKVRRAGILPIIDATKLFTADDWQAFREGDAGIDSFAEEVRRSAPVYPLVGGTAVSDFDWQGERIESGTWMLLDLYGTTHDPAAFPEPDRFDPDRRLSWCRPSHAFIPQGAGDLRDTHRCPGERVTVEILKLAIAFLARDMDWRLRPTGPLPRARFPAIPRGGVVLEDVWPRWGAGTGSRRFR